MDAAPNDEHLNRLRTAFPGIVDAPDAGHQEEPRGFFRGSAAALARPRSSQDVSRIVTYCAAHGIPIVPLGGGTGLVGGQVAVDLPGSLLLSLDRMNRVLELDTANRTMRVEAGAILSQVQAVARDAGLLFPLSLASEGSARIGGLLATNAGGVNVIRYGNARDLCLGIEAVLPDGSVMQGMRALRKDNTGYDLRNLLIGAEGTLGVITAAVLKLFDNPAEVVTALVTVPAPAAALEVLNALQRHFGELISAFELISRTGIDFVRATLPNQPLPPVGDGNWFVLLELGAGASAKLNQRFEAVLEALIDAGRISDGTVAQSDAQRHRIWSMREAIPEANRLVGAVSSHDISVPVSALPDFIAAGAQALARIDPGLRINCFGHMGDGNLHYNAYPPEGRSKDDYAHLRDAIKATIHDLVAQFDGSFSAEHGVGRLKKDDLLKYGDPARLAAMRAIKKALDPGNIMNPGAVIDARI